MAQVDNEATASPLAVPASRSPYTVSDPYGAAIQGYTNVFNLQGKNEAEMPRTLSDIQFLKDQYPRFSNEIDASAAAGYSVREITEYMAGVEATALYNPVIAEQAVTQDEFDVYVGRTPESKARSENYNHWKTRQTYHNALSNFMSEKQIDEMLDISEVTGTNPVLLIQYPELYAAMKERAGRRLGFFEAVPYAFNQLAEGMRQGDFAKRAAKISDMLYGGVETESVMQEVKSLVASVDANNKEQIAKWNVRHPDSWLGGVIISALNSAGFSIKSGGISGIANVAGTSLGALLGGPVGGVIGGGAARLAASAYNTNTEANMEAGEILMTKLQMALARGEDPIDSFGEIFIDTRNAVTERHRNNLIWLAAPNLITDFATFGLGTFGKGIMNRMARNVTLKAALDMARRPAMRIAVGALSEGIEEAGQLVIAERAEGRAAPSAGELVESFVAGSVISLGYMGAGRAIVGVANIARNRKPNMKINPDVDQASIYASQVAAGEMRPDQQTGLSENYVFVDAVALNSAIEKSGSSAEIMQSYGFMDSVEETEGAATEYMASQKEWDAFAAKYPEIAKLLASDLRTGTRGVTVNEKIVSGGSEAERLAENPLNANTDDGESARRGVSQFYGSISNIPKIREMGEQYMQDLSNAYGHMLLSLSHHSGQSVSELHDLFAREGVETVIPTMAQAAMYKNPAKTISEFRQNVLSGQSGKSFFEFTDQDGSRIEIASDDLVHTNKEHNLTNEQWQAVMDGMGNIEAVFLADGERGKYDGQTAGVKINTPFGKAGVVLEITKGGRTFLKSAFFSTDNNLDKWLGQERKGRTPRALETDESATAFSTGRPFSIRSIQEALGVVNQDETYSQGDNRNPNATIHRDPTTGNWIMGIGETANPTSPFHELFHWGLSKMIQLSELETTSDALIANVANVKAELGIADLDLSRGVSALTEEQHARYVAAQEKFARGAELFMSSGEAPNSALKEMFIRLKNILVDFIDNIRREFGQLPESLESAYRLLLNAPTEVDTEFRNATTVEELYARERRLDEQLARDGLVLEQGGDVIQRTTEEISRLEDEISAVDAMIEEIGETEVVGDEFVDDAEARNHAQNMAEHARSLEARKAELETALAFEQKTLSEARKEVAQYDKAVKDIKKAEDKERSWQKSFIDREKWLDRVHSIREMQREKQRIAKEKKRVARLIKQILKAATSKSVFAGSRQEINDILADYKLKHEGKAKRELRALYDIDPEVAEILTVDEKQDLDKRSVDQMLTKSITELEEFHGVIMAIAEQGKVKLREIQAERAMRVGATYSQAVKQQIEIGGRIGDSLRDKTITGKKDLIDKDYSGPLGKLAKGKDWLYSSTLSPSRLVDWVEQGKATFKGVLHNLLIDRTNRAQDQYLINSTERIANVEAQMKDKFRLTAEDLAQMREVDGESIKIDHLMHVYAAAKNEKAREAFLYGNAAEKADKEGFMNACIAALKESEKALADLILDDYRDNFSRMNQVLMNVYNEYMKQEDFYTPIKRVDYARTENVSIRTMLTGGDMNSGLPSGIDRSWSKDRQDIKPENQPAMELGLFEQWIGTVKAQEHFIAFAELAQDQKAVFARRPGKDQRESGELGKYDRLEFLIKRNFGKGTWTALDEYRRLLLNNDAAQADAMMSGVSSYLSRGMSTAYICYNFGTLLRQTTALFRGLAVADPQYLLSSCLELVTRRSEFLEEIYTLDPQMRARKYNPVIENLTNIRKEATTQVGAAYDTFIDKGFEGIEMMDRWVSSVVWNATYKTEIAKGKSLLDARNEAQAAVLRTQQPASAKEMPKMWRSSAFMRLAMIFTTDVAQEWNMGIYDVVQEVRGGRLGQAMMTITGVTLAAIYLKALRDGFPDDDDDDETWLTWMRDAFADHTISSIPLIGKELVTGYNMLVGNQTFANAQFGPMTAPFMKVIQGIQQIADEKKDTERGVWNVAEGVSLLSPYPIPIIAAKRTYQAGRDLITGDEDIAQIARSYIGMRKKKEPKPKRRPAPRF